MRGMREAWRRSLWAAALVGCGGRTGDVPVDSVPVDHESGTRLRANVIFSEDGSVARLAGFHDTVEDIDCEFVPETKTRYRCVPADDYTIPEYADAACTEPLVGLGACSGMRPRFATFADAARSCHDDTPILQVFEIDRPVAAPTLYVLSEGSCQQTTAGSFPIATTHPVDITRFVAADLRVERAGGGVGVRVLRAEDGAYEVLGLVDVPRGAGCTPSVRSDLGDDHSTYCIDTDGATHENAASTFGAADCSSAPVFEDFGDCRPSFVTRSVRAGGCERGLFVDAIGDELGGPVFQKGDTGCIAADPSGRAYATHPAPAAAFPALRSTFVGHGALRAQVFSRGDASLVANFALADGTPCFPVTLGGDLRCVPTAQEGRDFFEDGACGASLHRVPGACADTTASGLVTVLGTGCPGTPGAGYAVERIGERFSGPVYRSRPGGCTETEAPANEAYFHLDPVPSSTFPRLVRKTE